MADLIFYTNPMSRGRIVRWMLEEVGEPYRTEIVEFGSDNRTDDYLAINPMGKVPVVRHGDTVVTEAAAICAYLADAFPRAGLAPEPESLERGAYYRWLFFGAGPVEQAVTNRTMGFEVSADREGTVGYGSMGAVMRTLDSLLSDRRYILGDRFSAADVYLGSQIGWGIQFGTLDRLPSLETYWERLAARPAMIAANRLDNGLLTEKDAPD